MPYLIQGLDPAPFASLFSESDEALAAQNIVAVTADDGNFPCRVSLNNAAIGDRLLLLNYQHLPVASPYRSSHAIYVARGSAEKAIYRGAIPPVMRARILSIRAFDRHDMIIDADIVEGARSEALIERLLALPEADYLHVHFAKRGCFAAKVVRA